MLTLILTPDQFCDWQEVYCLLRVWNPSIRQQGSLIKEKGCFSVLFTTNGQEYFAALMVLQEILTPYGISFFLEETP